MAKDVSVTVDPRVAPQDCTTMAEVRVGVDALDRALVQLLAERQGYMDAAARIKPNRGVVRDVARIEDVVAKVKACSRNRFSTSLMTPESPAAKLSR
jgi:isochorismate pyruvate lyase